jgi:hypothetical protein
MPEKHTVTFVRIDSVNGVLESRTLYATDKVEWADRITDYLRQDWEGTKDQHEKVRNSRPVIVTHVDEQVHAAACARLEGRKNGLAARQVVMGQEFPTVKACAERLGVTPGAITQLLNKPGARKFEPGHYATAKVRGATIAYLDEYQLALQQNGSD